VFGIGRQLVGAERGLLVTLQDVMSLHD
jgi:hypothetical protein